MQANLGKFNLPYAEAIFELTYFLNNPAACPSFPLLTPPSPLTHTTRSLCFCG